jgi:gliding motility-associated-like protein
MSQKAYTYLIATLLLFSSMTTKANHIFGGDLLYKHIHDSTYAITLTLYGDCAAPGNLINGLSSAQPIIHMKNSVFAYNITLSIVGSGTEVTPVCPSEINNTSCRGGTLPGVKKFVYSDTVKLLYADANWSFTFSGELDTHQGAAGRSANITNIANVGNQVVYLVATLDNSISYNSSPEYTTVPTPFFCINVPQQYNQGALDNDGDSLSYSLVPALRNGSPVNYVPPFTGSNPLACAAGSFNYNNVNGQLSFNPNLVQNGLVVNKVVEYRNGVAIGSSMREMTFIVLSNCNNSAPNGSIDNNIIGGFVNSTNNNYVVNVCYGTPKLEFTISPSDPEGDIVNVTSTVIPNGANVFITNNNTLHPTINFSWEISSLPVGVYNFFVTYQDVHCPISAKQTVAYTINITKNYQANFTQLTPTECDHKAQVQFDIYNGVVPRTVDLFNQGVYVKSYQDSVGKIIDSLPAGIYSLFVHSPYFLCNYTTNFTINDSGTYPYKPQFISPLNICINTPVTPLNVTANTGATVQWYDANHQPITGSPIINSSVLGSYVWYATETKNVCTSDTAKLDVLVAPLPVVNIQNIPQPGCLGDTIFMKVTGGLRYEWEPADKTFKDDDSNVYIRLMEPTTYTVTAFTEYGCKDSSHITYSQIDPCCQFSYPTAFTPNADGRNDKYRVLVYGNLDYFDMSIYNRYGQRVFSSNSVGKYWDGTYLGKPCDFGTYYMQVHAKCVTGHIEDYKGDITLIR